MLKQLLFFSRLVVYASAASLQRRDQTLSTDQRISTYAASFGLTNQLTTVNADVTYWLSGGGTHNIFGNVFNNGEIIISQTDYLVTNPRAGGQTCDWVGHTATAGNLNISSTGSISVNDFGSISAPTYAWDIRTFTIYGSMQWCGRGDTGGSTYHLYCDLDCFNYGTLEYGQYFDNDGGAFFWRNAALAAPGATNYRNIYNYGSFRLTNVVFHNVQNIRGNGCIIIGEGGVLYLEDGSGYYQSYENGAYLPSLPNQSISMSGSNAVLHMDTQVYSHNANFGPQVYNFGPGKAIEFYEIIRTTTTGYSYNAVTGILNVIFTSGNQVNIKLGLGYIPTSFFQGRNPQKYNTGGYNAIFYSGVVPPQVVPTTCQPALQTCTDPAQTAGVRPTYTTQTAAYTGTAVVTSTVAQATGTAPGTVVIYTPASYVTQTSVYEGTVTATSTIAPATGTAPGTVVVYTPGAYITQTSAYTGANIVTSTVAQATGTAPGTVVVYYPATYVTQTSAYTGTVATTSTAVQASGTTAGTIVIYTPVGYITTTAPYTGTSQLGDPVTSTIAPAGTNPGTIVIYTQAAFATVSSAYTGPGIISAPTTTTIPPSGTAPGTVVVITPASYVTTSIQYTGPGVLTNPTTSTVPPSGTAPGTVVIVTPAPYVTTSLPFTGPGVITAPTTSTIPPSGTAPGTVVVFTPASYITTSAPYTGTDVLAGPLTTTVPPSGTAPGTVIVYTPASPSYVTTTLPYSATGFISGPITTTIPPSGTAPGTVAILTPTQTRPASVTTNIGPNQCFCTAV